MGQLVSLPLASLQTQLGVENKKEIRRALGREFVSLYRLLQGLGDHTTHQAVSPLVPEKQERLTHIFEEPVNNYPVLERVLTNMTQELTNRLHKSKLEARSLILTWELDGVEVKPDEEASPSTGSSQNARSVKLTRRRPTADLDKLIDSYRELFHRHWRRSEGMAKGVLTLTIILDDLVPARTFQLSLFKANKVAPAKIARQIQETITNMIAKHGTGTFFRPLLTDTGNPLPERRFRLQELKPV
jgi:hypothetical protein